MVTYEMTIDERKRPRAVRVRKSAQIRPNIRKASAPTSSALPWIAVSVFVLIAIAGTLTRRLPPITLVIYGVVSAFTFLLYGLDKSAARRGDRRTPETSLLFMGLVGGWPGAVVAQQTLRHKTRKQSFQWAFWGTAVVNAIALGWLLTDSGSRLAKQLLQ
jgi:uncharacterized membrane protein YsdA (DUF1294 family)